MQHGRSPSASSIAWTQQSALSTNGGSVSSGSPINSPLASPLLSPYASPCDSPRDQLHSQFARQMSLQPPSQGLAQPAKQSTGNTFVHKLYNMVVDKQYQHLIAWTYTGTSFIVCNITEFSRDVLPKHFKHNNFSSFVRQLNMYGFHKVNKSPRGHRGLAENQIWEFSHPKFVRGRPDLLDEIKRKALEQEVVRRDTGDINTHMTVMQVAQSDMMQQLVNLQENFSEIVRELADTRRRQQVQQQMLKQMLDYLTHQQGAQLQIPPEFNMDGYQVKTEPEQPPPPIYITSPDVHGSAHQLQNMFLGTQPNHTSPSPSPPPQPHTPPHQDLASSLPTRPAFPLTVQTQNLQNTSRLHTNGHSNFNVEQQHSPISPSQLSPNQMYAAMNTPLPPSPSPNSFLSDDEAASLYSPHSPNTPNVMTNASSNNSSTHLAAIDAFNFQQQHSQSLSPSGLTQQQQAADMFGYHMQSGAG